MTAPGKNVFQIFLSDSGEIPEGIRACMQALQESTPGYEYRLYDLPRLRAFLQENFPPDVLAAFDALRPYSYKADLGRFCLAHHFGGWYFDSPVTLQSPLPQVEGHEHVFFQDAPRVDRRSHDMSTSAFYAARGSKVMEKAISLIVENCRRRDYGEGPLDPTGPGLLGRALMLCDADPAVMTGSYGPLTPDHPRKNFAFVLPDGTILGWGKVTHGTPAYDGLRAFRAAGTNSYNLLWERGLVYVQPHPVKRYWEAASHIARTFMRRAVRKTVGTRR